MDVIRIANVDYLGGVAYRALIDQEICDFPVPLEYEENLPTENARKLSEGEVDIALVPTADFAMHGGFIGLDFGMVLCNQSRLVNLYARQPIETLRAVHLYPGSSSSSLLLRLLCRLRFAIAPRFIRTHAQTSLASAREGEGVLLCHTTPFESDMTMQNEIEKKGVALIREDLVETWSGLTGKPFVFLIWAARAGSLSPKMAHHFHRLFHRCIHSLPISARRHAASFGMSPGVCLEQLQKHFRFHLDESEIDGMEHFFSLAAQAGIAPQAYYRSATVRLFTPGIGGEERRSSVDSILEDTVGGKRLGIKDAIWLAERASTADLGVVADVIRRRVYADRVIRYVHTVREADHESGSCLFKRLEAGSLVGVSHLQFIPDRQHFSDLGYYERVLHRLKTHTAAFIEGFTVSDLLLLARLSYIPIEEVVSRLITAGLDLLEGAGGGMLLACSDGQAIEPSEWLKAIRWVHRFGARSSCCMRFAMRDSWEQRILHLHKLRILQDEDPGFRYFHFEDDTGQQTPSEIDARLRVQLVARIFLDNVPCFREVASSVAALSSIQSLAVCTNEVRVHIDSRSKVDSKATLYALQALRMAGLDFQSAQTVTTITPGMH